MTTITSTTSMPVLPKAAVAEIMTSLAEKQRISSDEIASILKKHEVTGNTEALQDSYRKRLGQRLMAAIRDEAGHREIFAAGKNYVIVDCCNDPKELQSIRRRLSGHMSGLDVSVRKVGERMKFLDKFMSKVVKEG